MATKLVQIGPKELLEKYGAGERDFSRTRLTGNLPYMTTLRESTTSGSDWSGRRMIRVYLNGSKNVGTNFSGIYAPGADFNYSNNQGAVFDGARLSGAMFSSSDNRGAFFRKIKYRKGHFPCFSLTETEGMHIDDMPLEDALDIVCYALEDGKVEIPERVQREVYSLDFHFLPGTQKQRVAAVKTAVEDVDCPFGGRLPPFYNVGSKLWKYYMSNTKPKEKVTQEDIDRLKFKLLRLVGVKVHR